METKKRFRLGKYWLVVGIAAGFIFLGMLFAILDGDRSTSDTLVIVGLCASSMSVFLLSMEEQKKKSCKTENPNV